MAGAFNPKSEVLSEHKQKKYLLNLLTYSRNSTMNPVCKKCEKTESILWRKDLENGEICNECYETEKTEQKIEAAEQKIKKEEADAEKETTTKQREQEATTVKETVVPEAKIRKSTRSTRFKNKAITRQKSTGKTSRRSNAFKGSRPQKTPNITAETKTKTNVFHDGFYYQCGDIVSVMSRGKKYYAQIRALIVDTFCEKSAALR